MRYVHIYIIEGVLWFHRAGHQECKQWYRVLKPGKWNLSPIAVMVVCSVNMTSDSKVSVSQVYNIMQFRNKIFENNLKIFKKVVSTVNEKQTNSMSYIFQEIIHDLIFLEFNVNPENYYPVFAELSKFKSL